MLRTILIDDEAHIRDTLTRLLARHCQQVSVVGEASGVKEGIRLIQQLHPDLVFLDLNLQDGSGFDLLNAFTTIDFKVIFISASDKNTVQAFQLSDLEYLLKPVNPEELMAAVSHAMQSEQECFRLKLKALDSNVSK